MSWTKSLLVSTLITSFTYTEAQADQRTASLVAHAYIEALPLAYYQSGLPNILNAYGSDFVEGGKALDCMKELSIFLFYAAAIEQRQKPSVSAVDRYGNNPALLDAAQEIDRKHSQAGVDKYNAAVELDWLVKVLPEATRNNWLPFNQTGSPMRQLTRQTQHQMQQLCQITGTCQVQINIAHQVNDIAMSFGKPYIFSMADLVCK